MEEIYQVLINKINESQNKLTEVRTLSEKDFICWGNKAKTYHQQVIDYPKTDTTFPSFQEKKQHVRQLQFLFSKIIVDLQFHDIIEQQAAHISKILLELKEETIFYQKHKQHSGSAFIMLVPKLIYLVIELLKLIDSIYTTTTNDVKQTLLNSLNDQELYKILNIDISETDNHSIQVHELIKKMVIDLHNTSLYFESLGISGDNNAESLSTVKNIFTMQKERELLCNVFEIENTEKNDDLVDFF